MITISLCMIVKNEEAVLPRILEQMKEIADEIIIVDTGSTDNTRALASGRKTFPPPEILPSQKLPWTIGCGWMQMML